MIKNLTNRDSLLKLMSSSDKPTGEVTDALDTDDFGGSSTDDPQVSSSTDPDPQSRKARRGGGLPGRWAGLKKRTFAVLCFCVGCWKAKNHFKSPKFKTLSL